ncbi:hypothetical protein A1O3_10496 [Capronia epimyces CBS 606.96]|uniref:Uncharacterized protein n=1 Tax=Capronia epimyces CBS 606.96 TaxID=1182542 RepID=W9XIT8_9EURO|nr:uncharacterized protein A1O3_10496 [Capronia epimyces CBS 606.96]EXJ76851.1 hypothetical protein A1O3_10496 [Capronia epimyces CBS 606.96]
MTSFADTAGLPENLSSRLGELRRDLEVLRSEHLAPFQANQFQYTATENDIIQTLYRSGRTIDRLLDADASVTSVGELPDPLLGFDVAEIGDNARKRTPEFQRYLSQLEDVDNIRERLTDVHSERSQLLEEQESRAKFGLSLDDESLQFLDASQEQERLLFEELDYAVLVLNALERLVDDEEALHIPDDHPYDEEDEKAGLAEAVGPMTLSDSSVARSIGQQDPLSFQPVLQTRNLKFAEHLAGPSTAPIPPANFINVWLLHRVYSLPGLLRQFTALLDTHGVAGDALSMESIFVTTWFNDSSAADFARHRTFADQQSKLVYMDDTQFLHQRSDAVYARQPASIPLLKMGPSTTAQDIITQAIRARASTLSQSFN